jgi:hypothetical protein
MLDERASPDALGRATALVILTAVVLLTCLLRLPAVAEPLGIDQSLFASGARALARGQELYRDAWDQKPPAIFLTYRAAFAVFGWTPGAIAVLDVAASVLTTCLLFAVVRQLGGPAMGTIAGTLFAVFTVPSWLYRHGGFLERSVAETFVVVCVSAAAWCAVRLKSRPRSVWLPAGLGLAIGVAIVYKPNAGLYLPALLAWTAFYRAPDLRTTRVIGIAIVAAAVPPAITVAWLWSHGVLPEARIALVDFNRFYVAQSFSANSFAMDFAKDVWRRCKTDPLWAAGGIGAIAAVFETVRSRRIDAPAALAIVWGGAAALVIAVNGAWLFNTYFIQVFPPLAMLAAWVIARGGTNAGLARMAAVAAMLAIAVPVVRRNYPIRVFEAAWTDFEQWRGRGDTAAYLDRFGGYGTGGGYSAHANAELFEYVRGRTRPDDLIYQFGINSAGVYFAADRLPAQRFLRVNEFVPAAFPSKGFDLASVAAELGARRPAYLIFERLPGNNPMVNAVNRLPESAELAPLLQAYRQEIRIEDFTLYRRRD